MSLSLAGWLVGAHNSRTTPSGTFITIFLLNVLGKFGLEFPGSREKKISTDNL